jgi:hypothetical protein
MSLEIHLKKKKKKAGDFKAKIGNQKSGSQMLSQGQKMELVL